MAPIEEAHTEAEAPQLAAEAQQAQPEPSAVLAAPDSKEDADAQPCEGEEKGLDEQKAQNCDSEEAPAAQEACGEPAAGDSAGATEVRGEEAVVEPEACAEPAAADPEVAKEALAETAAVELRAPEAPEVPEILQEESAMQVEPGTLETTAPNEAAPEAQDAKMAGDEATAKPADCNAAKRRRGSAAVRAPPSLEAMAGRIKALQEEASQARALLKQKNEDNIKKIQEMEAEEAGLLAEADSKEAAARKASQDYVKKQGEAALAELDARMPKRPPAPFFIFTQEVKKPSKQVAEMWSKLSDDDKKKYRDRFDAGMKIFKEWGASEEGKQVLREHDELLKKSRVTGKEELEKAVGALDVKHSALETPVKKRHAEHGTHDNVVKQRRVSSGQASVAAKGLVLDELVLEEAGQQNLEAQLRNLASRPEILALGRSSQELLNALKAHSGMVNAAKHSLLSA